MRKLLPLINVLVAASLFSCVGAGGESQKPEVVIGKTTLAFDASGNSSQTVDVTANVEWSVSVASSAAEWLHATKTDSKTITVSVEDNDAEQRSGILTISAVDGSITPKKVTVTQAKAAEQQYSLSVDPAAMTFGAEEAEPQTATVMVSDPQLKWSAAPEDEIKEWVTVTAEGDRVTVSVLDNPETTPRAGNVIITPAIESAPKKAIRVTQEGRILPPSLELSARELTFDAIRGMGQSVTVKAVNVNWTAQVVREEGADVSWIEMSITNTEENSYFTVNVATNPLLEERRGYIEVKSNHPEVEDIMVTVIQEAGVEHLSDLTDNVNLEDISDAVSHEVFFSPNQTWHDRDYASWDIELWGATVDRKKDWQGFYHYSGNGTRLFLRFRSERIVHNDDEEYVLPSGEYVVCSPEESVPWSIAPGERTNNFATPLGSWYMKVAGEDTYSNKAPVTGGTITVSHNGDEYTFILDLTDDAGFNIAGRCVTKLDNMKINFHPLIDPSSKPKPEEPTEPEEPVDPEEPTPY